MSKSLVEIKGFDVLERKLKSLTNDKVKRREVIKLLGQVANPTVKVARNYAPSAGHLQPRIKTYVRKKRQVRNVVVEQNYTSGLGKESIGKKILRKARNPMLVVRANDKDIGGKKGYGGFYMRQWVIRGTKNYDGNPFMDTAYRLTKGRVTKDAELKMARYIQKQINRLST